MSIDLSTAGVVLPISLIAALACTVWYGRIHGFQHTGPILMIVFAWLVPVIGPIAAIAYQLAARSDA